MKHQLIFFTKLLLKIIFYAIVLYILIWMYDAMANRRYASRVYVELQDRYSIVAVGDSLVEGLGSQGVTGFVGLLEQRIGIPIYNAGIRRDQTRDVLARLENDVLVHNPEIVILVVGGNDMLRAVPHDQVLENLELIFKKLQEKNITVLFGEVTDDRLFGNYNQQVRQLAQQYNVMYIPNVMDGIFWTFRYKFDALHPDDRGYQVIADRIEPYLRDAITSSNKI